MERDGTLRNEEMTDRLSPERRSWLMSRVRSNDTGPEIRVRQAVHAMRLRFRLHRKDLPGQPDLVLPRWRIVIFVHGCFWHRHLGCRKASEPKSNPSFWQQKFEANIARDARVVAELEKMGWHVIVIWECETVKRELLDRVLAERVVGRDVDADAGGTIPV